MTMTTTPKSAKIPQWSIGEVAPILQALRDLDAASSSARIAQQLGISPTGGKFRSQLGTAGYYGATRRKGGLHELTPRGAAIVGSDEDAARKARREAVMSTPLGPIIRRFAGREPNASTISARLEDDHGAASAASEHLAGVLVRSAQEAELLANHRFDAAAIEETKVAASGNDSEGSDPQAGGKKSGRGESREKQTRREEEPKQEKKSPQEDPAEDQVNARPFGPAVQVVVNVDATNWTPQQVSELLASLRDETEPKPADSAD